MFLQVEICWNKFLNLFVKRNKNKKIEKKNKFKISFREKLLMICRRIFLLSIKKILFKINNKYSLILGILFI